VDRKTIVLGVVIVAMLFAAYLLFVRDKGPGPKSTPSRDMMIDHVSSMSVEQLKSTRQRWTEQLEMYKANPKTPSDSIQSAQRNIADIDRVLIEKGIDPASLTAIDD
jgi:hypothetical protein